MALNKPSEKSCQIGLDYYSVKACPTQTKHQLLKSLELTDKESDYRHLTVNFTRKNINHIDSLIDQFKFSYDVVAERCSHLLPYDEKFYDTVYKLQSVPTKKKMHKLSWNKSGVPRRHVCRQNERKSMIDRMIPVDKLNKTRYNSDWKKDARKSKESVVDDEERVIEERPKRYWDEYLLSLMSRNTAEYLAHEKTPAGDQADRLKNLLYQWYGPPPDYRELIPDCSDRSDESDETSRSSEDDLTPICLRKHRSNRSKKAHDSSESQQFQHQRYEMAPTTRARITQLLNKEKSLIGENDQTDPYGDRTKASFYRLPVLVRKEKKQTKEINIESINRTTKTLKEFTIPETPPKIVNPKIGDKVLKAENQFEKDLFISEDKQQTKLLNSSDNLICIDDKIYLKNLQPIWPSVSGPDQPSEDQLDSNPIIIDRVLKGHNRWTRLPVEKRKDLMTAIDVSNSEQLERQLSRKRDRQHSSLNLLVDQWRKKWHLSQKFADSSTDELLQDMADIHPTIRMQAIVTAAKAASIIHSQKSDKFDLDRDTINSDCLPPVLVNAIEILLDDPHFQVRKAAAIALHSLEKSTEKSLKILEELLTSKTNVDRWSAVQCLALSNKCDSRVISELIDQLMNSEDILVHEKASYLLSKISYHTKLAHGMLGERLNTISWRQRVIICKTIPLLHGSLNKDLLRKLIYIMWHDSHKQVRIAASHVLGRTGNGKAVHDELISKLQNASDLVRADALEKIGILKVMTTRMMPELLKCFKDEFVTVRKEVCIACCRLKIADKIIVNHLLEIARYDPLWKVKFYAIRALSKIKNPDSEIQSCFLWAIQYESQSKLRLEALRALSSLSVFEKEVIDIIKTRFLVENNRAILSMLKQILVQVNINPKSDINTISEIKTEVRRFLSDKDHIIDVILENEASENYTFLKEKMIASPTTPTFEDDEASENDLESSDNESDEEIQIVSRTNSGKSRKNITSEMETKPSDLEHGSVDLNENGISKEISEAKKSDVKNCSNTALISCNDNEHDISHLQPAVEEEEEVIEGEKEEVFMEGNKTEKDNMIENRSEKLFSPETVVHMNTDLENIEKKNLNDEEIEKENASSEERIEENSAEAHPEDKSINTEIAIEKDLQIDQSKESENASSERLISSEIEENSEKYDREISSENNQFKQTSNLNNEDKAKPDERNSPVLFANKDDIALVDNVVALESVEDTENKDGYSKEDVQKSEEDNHSLMKVDKVAQKIRYRYKLPVDSNYIKVFDPEYSRSLSSFDCLEYDVNTDLLESTLNQDILEQIHEAIGENGLDFSSKEQMSSEI